MKRILTSLLLVAGCSQAPMHAHAGAGGEPHKSFAQLNAVDVAPLAFAWTPETLKAACSKAIEEADQHVSDLLETKPEIRDFENTFGAYEILTTELSDEAGRLGFMKDVHPDEKVRAAGAACEEETNKYFVKLGSRKDVYAVLKGWLDGAGAKANLAGEDKTLVELTARDFRRNGLELNDADREKLVQIRSRLAELQTQFETHIAEDKAQAEFTAKELDGMPASFIERLAKGKDGKLVVTTKYPDFFPIMENCKVEDTRHKMYVLFENRGGTQNLALLDEAVSLRDQAAKLLGYKNHVDFVTETRMAKNAQTVNDFENRLRDELKPRLASDTDKMKALKAAETKQKTVTINAWDWRYYLNEMKKKEFSVDDEAVRAYFPVDKVMSGLFTVYSTLLGVDFKTVSDPKVWSPGVSLYEVRDHTNNRLLAKFYIDMFPRPGKYAHAACFPLGLARELHEGYQIPLSTLVVNFNPPEHGQPAHLSVEEVDTLFHEFGHVMHASLTTALYASLAGTNVATDFVEAPSQMLENWVFKSDVLKLVSQDPKDATKTLPEDLMKRIIAARKFDSGVRYSRQVFLGTFDYRIHSGVPGSSDKEEKKTWADVLGFPEDPNAHFAASFGHLMGGYDAGYYGYLWSEVFAADMFTRFQKEGVLNPTTGRDYRNIILAKGRTEDPDQLLKEFLGRAPNEEAFLKMTGIKQ